MLGGWFSRNPALVPKPYATPPSKHTALSLLLAFDECGCAHARADAHGHHAVPPACALQLRQQRCDLARARAAQRVAKCNGASLGVDFLWINAELPHAVHRLGCKRLVDFKDVNVVDGQAGLAQQVGDGERGADAHHVGVDARNGVCVEGGQRLQAVQVGGLARHQQHRRRTVAHLAAVAGRGGAIILEGGTQPRELLRRGIGTDALILHDRLAVHLHRDDLAFEKAACLRGSRLHMRLGRERVLLCARDVKALGNILAGLAHGHHAVRSQFVGVHKGGQLRGHRNSAVVDGHALNPSADAHVDVARPDGCSDVCARLQAAAALAVDGAHRGLGREPCVELGHARDGGATAGGEDVANNNVIHLVGGHAHPLHTSPEGCGKHFLLRRILEATATASADGSSHRADDHDVIW
mmetsp:Transcript_49677/g.124897  ORF Transcript_49677/g.124897 Transcript_49677/m.124897 type:complete len:411 (+) Transcript_49677:103-1335(+)